MRKFIGSDVGSVVGSDVGQTWVRRGSDVSQYRRTTARRNLVGFVTSLSYGRAQSTETDPAFANVLVGPRADHTNAKAAALHAVT